MNDEVIIDVYEYLIEYTNMLILCLNLYIINYKCVEADKIWFIPFNEEYLYLYIKHIYQSKQSVLNAKISMQQNIYFCFKTGGNEEVCVT